MLMCCLSCANIDWCKQADRVEDSCISYEERPMTNADLVRQMSDEELARYYAKRIVRCYGCEAVTEDDCFECQLEWLKSPVEVDNG